MKYIGLLRGVNVGGNNIIKMASLKASFEEHGFAEVSTYINSGNVIFKSDNPNKYALKNECEVIIKETFGLDIAVAVVEATEFLEAVDNAPIWWNEDPDSKHNALVVIPPTTAEELVNEIGTIEEKYEKADFYGSMIFWSAPKSTISRSRWFKTIGTPSYRCVTIRNANTILKLADLINR